MRTRVTEIVIEGTTQRQDKAKDGMADDRSRSNDGVGAQSRFTSRTLNEILSDNNMEDSASDCQNRSEERDEPDPGAIGNRTHEQEISKPYVQPMSEGFDEYALNYEKHVSLVKNGLGYM